MSLWVKNLREKSVGSISCENALSDLPARLLIPFHLHTACATCVALNLFLFFLIIIAFADNGAEIICYR